MPELDFDTIVGDDFVPSPERTTNSSSLALLAPAIDTKLLMLLQDRTPDGGRNTNLAAYVGAMAKYGLPYEETVELSRLWNNANCDPPLPDAELVDLIKKNHKEWYINSLSDKALKDVTSLAGATKIISDNTELSEDDIDGLLLNAEQLLKLAKEQGPTIWVLPGVIALGGINFLTAPPGAGKSIFATDLSICLAEEDKIHWSGINILEAISPEGKPVRILYLDGDLQAADFGSRSESLGMSAKSQIFWYKPSPFSDMPSDIREPKLIALLQKIIRIKKIDIAVIDPLSAWTAGMDTIASGEVTKLRKVFDLLRYARNMREDGTANTNERALTTIFIPLHDNKNGKTEGGVGHYRMSGSAQFGAMADSVVGIDKTGSVHKVTIEKFRHISEDEAFSDSFAISTELREDGKKTMKLIGLKEGEAVQMADTEIRKNIIHFLRTHGEQIQSRILDGLGGSRQKTLDNLNALVTEGKVTKEKRNGKAMYYSVNLLALVEEEDKN